VSLRSRAWARLTAVAAVTVAFMGLSPLPTDAAATVGAGHVRVALHRIVSGLPALTSVTSARDGSGRLFVVEQQGVVRVVRSGKLLSTAYLNISREVLNSGEQGLLSIAFHPDFAHHPYVYAAYVRSDGALQVSRFKAATSSAASVSASTEYRIISVPHPNQTNHNGGQLMFGTGGYLFITTGDGGGGGDQYGNAENLGTLLGKLLRIGIDGSCGSLHYCIPGSNPYRHRAGAKPAIYASGLRNAWRASVDRGDGTLWLGDVGQDNYEEIDHVSVRGGIDFGWSCREGNATYSSGKCAGRSMTKPVHVYSHQVGCAVVGGYAYHGPDYPFAHGVYLLADYCSGHFWALGRTSSGGYTYARVGQASGSPTGMGEADRGEIYVVDAGGSLWHVAFSKV
jgi:glucose/arabinose dehydrogenase